MVLSREDLLAALAVAPPLVEDVAPDAVQPNGIDISLATIEAFAGQGTLGIATRQPAPREPVLDTDGWWSLVPGAYVIGYAERVNLPNDVMAFGRPRSSLLRSGVTVHTAVWDAGYSGRGEGLLSVLDPNGWRVQRGARLVQLVFLRLTSATRAGYAGRYQGEGRSLKE